MTGGGGIKLHVEEAGNPKGKPILFIHAFSQCGLAWTKQLLSDLANGFRLVAMDIRGHGLSEKPLDAYGDSQLWAEDVRAVITTLGLDHPVLCGCSYGGVIICDYLRSYGEAKIAGISLVGAISKLGDAVMPLVGATFATLSPGFFSDDVGESMRSLQAYVSLCFHEEPSSPDYYRLLGCCAICPPYVRRALFSRSLTNDDLLPSIRKPVLITHGEADAFVLPEASPQHATAIRHAQTSFYPDVGHAPFWEATERFNRELRAFVTSV